MDILDQIKRPFIRYLNWVYMTVDENNLQIGSKMLHHDR